MSVMGRTPVKSSRVAAHVSVSRLQTGQERAPAASIFVPSTRSLFFMATPVPDWRLPPGVTRDLWDYVHSPALAQGYDAGLLGSGLAEADVAFVAEHCPQPGRLLDLGCGTGRLLIPFARRGYWVLGVDLSEEMLKVARAKAAAEGVAVQVLKGNLVELDALTDQSFDYAACLFSTLGMVAPALARRRVVGHAYRLLRSGGRFMFHVHNRWWNVRDPGGRRWLVADTFRKLLRRPNAGDRTMPPHQGLAGLTLHHFTRREAIGLLAEAGFEVVEVRPVGLGPGGKLAWPHLLPTLRAAGYLLAARKP
jgi:SAM-dependent methyltransferase